MKTMNGPQTSPSSSQPDTQETVHTEEPQQYSNIGRFHKWVGLAILSFVAWLAMVATLERHQRDGAEKWALTSTTLSVVFATLGVLCYLFARGVFAGTLLEVVLAVVILGIQAGGLPVIMNPKNDIAVEYTDGLNANLYFSSWFSFFGILWICGDLLKERTGMDLVSMATPLARSRTGMWYGLVATSIIVLSAATRVFKSFPCSADVMSNSSTCRKTRFAISAGVIGSIVAMLATLLLANGRLSAHADGIFSIVMLCIWSFGLGFITFGQGPGKNIGNLYFSTWGSFILSVLLVAEAYRDVLIAREQAQNPSNSNGFDDGEIEGGMQTVQVETFGDGDL